ncbi:MAG: hypothetical protein ATN35_01345 [Epulopiscium sp. Nele67-Bin004]|nr:MAG: hypothetical protein ATN35_01345 [Epulopiscium sp. Nele67-Bin004]
MQKKIINILGNLILVLCFYFICTTILSAEINWGEYLNNPINWVWYTLVIVIYAGTVWYKGSLYYNIVKIFNSKIDKAHIVNIYVVSNLGKYLPGNVMHFVGRNVMATKYGISQFNIGISTILEILIILFGGITVALLFGYDYLLNVTSYIEVPYIVAICILGVVALSVIYIKKNIFLPVLHVIKNNFYELWRVFTKNCIMQLVTAMTFLFVIGEMSTDIIGIYMLAWTIGFVMPGAPGGIGVRESILIFLLPMIGISVETVVATTIIHRVFNIIAEIVAFALTKVRRLS